MSGRRRPVNERQGARRYEIRVAGHLHARWGTWFDGFRLTHEPDGSTVIAGLVADQAALHGLLQRVRDIGLPLISVTRIDERAGDRDPERPALEPPAASPHRKED